MLQYFTSMNSTVFGSEVCYISKNLIKVIIKHYKTLKFTKNYYSVWINFITLTLRSRRSSDLISLLTFLFAVFQDKIFVRIQQKNQQKEKSKTFD